MFKKKKENREEEYETKFEVFMRNYREVPGFRALVKLGGYALFIIVFVALAANAAPKKSTAKEETQTTTTISTTASPKQVYGEILNDLRKTGTSLDATIKEGEATYKIEGTVEENLFAGYFNDITGSKKFTIKENNVYEKTLDQEVMNNTLLGNIDIDFIVPSKLVDILTKNKALKVLTDDTTIYTYNITKNNVSYEIKTYIKESKCSKIEIISSGINYLMTYK